MKWCIEEATLWSLIDGGVGIVGGLEKISKINSRGGGGVGIIGGVGKNLSDSHFLYIVTVRL